MFVRIELLDNLGMRMLTIRKKEDKQPRLSNLQGQTAVDAAATPVETQECIVAGLRELSPSLCGCRASRRYAVKERWTAHAPCAVSAIQPFMQPSRGRLHSL